MREVANLAGSFDEQIEIGANHGCGNGYTL
jgi:hypothetical protein